MQHIPYSNPLFNKSLLLAAGALGLAVVAGVSAAAASAISGSQKHVAIATDGRDLADFFSGHGKNLVIFLGLEGSHCLTPIYDIPTAQSSIDAGQFDHRPFRPTMSIGTNEHDQYAKFSTDMLFKPATQLGRQIS